MWPGCCDARQPQRLLVQRQGGDGVDPPGQGQVDRRHEELVRRPAGPGVDPARRDVEQGVALGPRARIEAGDQLGRRLGLLRPVDRGRRSPGCPTRLESPSEDVGIADHQRAAESCSRVRPGPGDHLGADAGHVAHRQGHPGPLSTSRASGTPSFPARLRWEKPAVRISILVPALPRPTIPGESRATADLGNRHRSCSFPARPSARSACSARPQDGLSAVPIGSSHGFARVCTAMLNQASRTRSSRGSCPRSGPRRSTSAAS